MIKHLAYIPLIILFVLSCEEHSVFTYGKNCVPDPQAVLQNAVFEHGPREIISAINNGAKVNSPIGCGNFLPLEGAIVINNISNFNVLVTLGSFPNDRTYRAANRSSNRYFIHELLKMKPKSFD